MNFLKPACIFECAYMYEYVSISISSPHLDDFPESTGVKRIIQALNANVWSNVVMKSGE